MEKAIRFNPLNDDETVIYCESDFILRDEFYIHTSVAKYCLAGEVWKDTPKNRDLIEKIIRRKQAIKEYTRLMSNEIHEILNQRER